MTIMEPVERSQSLARFGIEEIEANVCEDTFENRQKLNNAKIPFTVFEPGTIEVLWHDWDKELGAHQSNMYEKYRYILADPKDPWSDFFPMLELPLDYMEIAPAWIQRQINKYNDALEEGVREDKIPLLPGRCRRKRADGSRCWRWGWPAVSCKGMCRAHADQFAFDAVGQLAKIRDASRMRIAQVTPKAVDVLEDLMLNSQVPAVRLKAATELLDRDGIRGGTELTVSGSVDHQVIDPAQVVRDRLEGLAKRLEPKELEAAAEPAEGEIVDAEIVEEPAEKQKTSR